MSSDKTLFMQTKLASSIIQFAEVSLGVMKKPSEPKSHKEVVFSLVSAYNKKLTYKGENK